MNIVVIQGSPSGNKGVTAQSVSYLSKRFAEHEFEYIEVSRRIRKIERDADLLDSILERMERADAIVWAFPVYLMLVPAQMKRFIELAIERAEPGTFEGKVATALSTSAHHYDHTAHDYLHGISCDLGMSYVRGFSAEIQDLFAEEGRANLEGFARDFFRRVEGEAVLDAVVPPVEASGFRYEPSLPDPAIGTGQGRIVVIDDSGPEDHNLRRMIEVFERSVSVQVDRIELAHLRMDGGCLGCMKCSDGAACVYRDEYEAAFEDRVKPADVVVYAGAIRDRFFSARMKTFIDRFFSNGHRPVMAGSAVGFLVSGPLAQLPNLREMIEAHIEVGGCHRLGVVTDEHASGDALTRILVSLAQTADRWIEQPWVSPATFRGVGAQKNFRDLIYSYRGIMSADHRFYRDNGLYDFPTRDRSTWLVQTALLWLRRIPGLNRRIVRWMMGGKMRTYSKLLETV